MILTLAHSYKIFFKYGKFTMKSYKKPLVMSPNLSISFPPALALAFVSLGASPMLDKHSMVHDPLISALLPIK